MRTFEKLDSVPMGIIKAIATINEYKGKQELFGKQSPEMLVTLQEIARIQSTESSNRIEGIEISNQKLKEIMAQKIDPQDRSEAEISGYRDVLNLIHASAAHMPVKPRVIQQLHRDMYKYLPQPGGVWKGSNNNIEETLPNGSTIIRFRPLDAHMVPIAMDSLCSVFNKLRDKGEADDILLILSFILDFLCVHPFGDGNGRVSRLLMLLLMYQAGFKVGRYISLERIIEESKETYYDALFKASQGWHEKEHNPIPWIEYSLGIIVAAYKEFEGRVNILVSPKGSKTALTRDTILRFHGDFSMQDVEHTCPNVSRPTIYRVLTELKEEGIIECIVPGRHAKWKIKT